MIGETVYYMKDNRIRSSKVIGWLKSEGVVGEVTATDDIFFNKNIILTCHGRFDKKEVFDAKEELIGHLLKGIE